MPHDNIGQNEQTGGKAMPATGLSSPDHAGPNQLWVADLCARLRRPIVPLAFGLEAADALERLRAERDCLKHELAEVRSVLQVTIAARNTYMAERNFLAAIVRAAWKEEA